jgi:hypothetical protein
MAPSAAPSKPKAPNPVIPAHYAIAHAAAGTCVAVSPSGLSRSTSGSPPQRSSGRSQIRGHWDSPFCILRGMKVARRRIRATRAGTTPVGSHVQNPKHETFHSTVFAWTNIPTAACGAMEFWFRFANPWWFLVHAVSAPARRPCKALRSGNRQPMRFLCQHGSSPVSSRNCQHRAALRLLAVNAPQDPLGIEKIFLRATFAMQSLNQAEARRTGFPESKRRCPRSASPAGRAPRCRTAASCTARLCS